MACEDAIGYEVAFVTAIPVTGAAITGTMCLTDDKWCVTKDTRFNPPPRRRAEVSSMLMDGSRYPAAVYDNRVIELRLTVEATDADDLVFEIQRLLRELEKTKNTLMVKLSTTEEVYFRTFTVSPENIRMITRQQNVALIAVDILAEPFAYGRPVTVEVTVNSDPASGVNGTFFDVENVRGDVPAATIFDDQGAFFNVPGVMAIRRRGDPDNIPYVRQAEDMTQLTDTTVQPHDTEMSGDGPNFSRTDFSTSEFMTSRLRDFVPDFDSVDARGTYRVFLRVRRASGFGQIDVRLVVGFGDGFTGFLPISTVTTENIDQPRYVDLGLMQIPLGADPVQYGPSGRDAPVNTNSVFFEIHAERLSGTDTIDFDVALLVPADDQIGIIDVGNDTTFGIQYDSYADMAYGADTFAVATHGNPPIDSTGNAIVLGSILEVKPGVTNRFYVRAGHLISTVNDYRLTHWPRYLFMRPEAT